MWTEVSTWLHQRFCMDHHLRLAERIPLYSRGAKGTNIMRPLLTLRRVPAIRFRYDTPDQRGFSFCSVAIKSRKQFAARNSYKGDGRTAVWAILFNDGTLKRRGHLIHFRHELRQIPLPSVVCFFVSNFSVHRLRSSFSLYQNSFLAQSYCSLRVSAVSWQSDHPAICLSSVRRPFFAFSRPGHGCLSYGFRHTLPRIRIAPVNQTVLAHIVFVLTVGILTLVKTPGSQLLNALIFDYPLLFLFL